MPVDVVGGGSQVIAGGKIPFQLCLNFSVQGIREMVNERHYQDAQIGSGLKRRFVCNAYVNGLQYGLL